MSNKDQREREAEKVEGAPLFTESDAEQWLQEFCLENDIDNIKTESQNVYTAALIYIQRHLIPDRELLKDKRLINNGSCMPTNNNCFNYDLLDNILAIYIYLCFKYDKEISIFGYASITGISIDTVNEWVYGSSYNTGLSARGIRIGKILTQYRQESLSAKLTSGKGNPVGVLAILNRFYSWNMPGVSRERNVKVLTAADLPKLGKPGTVRKNFLDVSCHKADENETG